MMGTYCKNGIVKCLCLKQVGSGENKKFALFNHGYIQFKVGPFDTLHHVSVVHGENRPTTDGCVHVHLSEPFSG